MDYIEREGMVQGLSKRTVAVAQRIARHLDLVSTSSSFSKLDLGSNPNRTLVVSGARLSNAMLLFTSQALYQSYPTLGTSA